MFHRLMSIIHFYIIDPAQFPSDKTNLAPIGPELGTRPANAAHTQDAQQTHCTGGPANCRSTTCILVGGAITILKKY